MNQPSPKLSSRLASLDFMRGVIMVLLMLESSELYFHLRNVTPENTVSYSIISQFFHRNWEGLNFWDLIQPAFMMMAGAAMAYSSKKQIQMGVTWNARFRKILKRCGWLLFWGIFKRITFPNWLLFEALDVTDILTQLAFTTMIAFFILEWNVKHQTLFCVGVLVLTEFLYRFLYIPDMVEGFTQGKNFGSYLDWILLNQPNNNYVFINWLPTSVHTIAGVIAGKLLIENNRPLLKIAPAGILLILIGYGLNGLGITPIIKPIATSSFVMASLGYCLLILAFFYWWIDVKNHKKYLFFFQIVGMNSIFIYLFCDIIGRNWLNHYGAIVLGPMEHTFGMPTPWFLVFSSLAVFTFEWFICRFLYHKKLFFKV